MERFEEQLRALRAKATEKAGGRPGNALKRIAPTFVGRGIDPQDVKVIFHPVEYVSFRGLIDGDLTAIEFIDRAPDSAERERLQGSRANHAGSLE